MFRANHLPCKATCKRADVCARYAVSMDRLWWPRTAIRNFLDNSRKFNFCNRLILKLLRFFFYKENFKDVLFIVKTQFIFKTLEFILLLKVLQIIFKTIIFKGVFVFILEALHFYFGFILFFVCSCFRFFFP